MKKSILPCSIHQQRWLIAHEHYDLSQFNLHFLLKLEGDFDESDFLEAVTHVLSGHDISRTAFAKIEGTYQRIVYEHSTFKPEKLVFNDEQAFFDFCQQQASQSFDFTKPPLIYSAYATVGNDHYWFFVLHHIVGDVSSGFVLSQQVHEHYLKKSVQHFNTYDAYIACEEKRYQMLGKKALAYWSQQFADCVPLSFSAQDMDAKHSQIHMLSFSKAVTDQVHDISATNHFSLHTLFSLPLYLTYYTLAHGTKPVMAIPVSERRNAVLKSTPGFISGPMLVSLAIDRQDTLKDLLKRGQTNFVSGLKFYLPIARYAHLFECNYRVMFNVFDYRAWECEKSSFNMVHQLMISPNTMQLEIFWVVFAYRDKIEMAIHYDQSCIDKETIERIGRYYTYFLDRLLDETQWSSTLTELIDAIPHD